MEMLPKKKKTVFAPSPALNLIRTPPNRGKLITFATEVHSPALQSWLRHSIDVFVIITTGSLTSPPLGRYQVRLLKIEALKGTSSCVTTWSLRSSRTIGCRVNLKYRTRNTRVLLVRTLRSTTKHRHLGNVQTSMLLYSSRFSYLVISAKTRLTNLTTTVIVISVACEAPPSCTSLRSYLVRSVWALFPV